MNEDRRSLTPQERRQFEEIQARLSQEMPDPELPRADWQRWRKRTMLLAAVVGLGLLVIGLLITFVVMAFVGFAVLAFALWRISYALHLRDWVARVRSVFNGSWSDDGDPPPGPR